MNLIAGLEVVEMSEITELAFTDEEFEQLKEAKGDDTWHDFILKMLKWWEEF